MRGCACAMATLFALQDAGAAPVPRAEPAAGAMPQAESATRDLHSRMRLPARLTNRLDDLGGAAAVGRMVVAQAAAVGVHGEPALSRDQAAALHEAAALPLLAKSEVLERDDYRDREAV